MIQISKCWCLCLIAMFALTTAAFAQEDGNYDEPVIVYDPDEVDGRDGRFNINKLVIGGFGTLGGGGGITNDPFYGPVQANQFTYGGTPFIGYRFVNDRWISGLGFNFFQQSTVLNPGTGETPVIINNVFGGRILSRYLLFHIGDPAGIYAQAEFGRNRGRDKYRLDGEIIYKTDPVSTSSLLFGLGYTSNHYQGFGYNFEVFYDVLAREEFVPLWSQLVPRIGITWGF